MKFTNGISKAFVLATPAHAAIAYASMLEISEKDYNFNDLFQNTKDNLYQ